jgi:membrane dipeptidase
METGGGVSTPRADNRGFHPVLEGHRPYLFVDACMQAWPDADFENAHRHGCSVYGVTAWLPNVSAEDALEGLMYWHLTARKNPNLVIAYSVEDIRNAHAAGKSAFLLAAQDGDFIANKLHRVEAFYRLGLRMMLPAYNASNLICDGCLDKTERGLTNFGRLVVAECNRVGLLLDCTHIGRRSSLDIIEQSDHPTVFSHANPKALFDNPRNIDDEQIQMCAAKGGVIGVVPWGPLAFRKGSSSRPTLSDLVDAIDHIADLTGDSSAIGIGTDFSLGSYPAHPHDPWGQGVHIGSVMADYNRFVPPNAHARERFVAGFSSYPEVLGLADALRGRGYDEAQIRGILGENFVRVFEQVWKPA